jgi:hypothetical protein
MDNKDLASDERKNVLLKSFGERTPKQMRTVRNNLNNRIVSFEQEMKFGKALPALSASHLLHGFDLKDCRLLLEAAKKQIKKDK